MIVVADASVLVAELLRQRGRALFARPDLRVVVAEEQWNETEHEHQEAVARRRVPRDPNDWPPVALALALDVGILTRDQDFLGCGCPTWTVETLRAELGEP